MPECCGSCRSYVKDFDYPVLYGECVIKARIVAYHAICDINKWRPKL